MIDGAHSVADTKNLSKYLKTINLPLYGIWAMTKNKEPDLFIKQLKNVFKKIVTIPIKMKKVLFRKKTSSDSCQEHGKFRNR